MPEVVVYTTNWCPYCVRAKALLRRKGAAFREVNIEEVPGAREEMEGRSGRMTVPQVFIGGRHVGGCDDLHALDRAGGLDPLLAA
ncbi:MAG TPA: glutaredoxin 3 [Candidatus Thermoplasmatota archaeon]|nr:glutaredoxin 3 [Candidatus Thermoplasmatota archaeon]